MLFRGSRSDRNQSNSASNTENASRAVGGTGSGTAATSAPNNSGPSGSSSSAAVGERDAFSRWRDRQYFNPRRWFQNSRDDTAWERDTGLIIKFIHLKFYVFFN